MNTIYIFFWALVASYFVFKKRDIDLYSIVFFTTSYYSYPLFFGFLFDPENHIYPEIDRRIYAYYMLFFACLLVGTWCRDRKPICTSRMKNPIPYEWFFLAIGFLSIILILYPGFFTPSDIDSPTRPALLGPIYPLYVWTSLGLFWLALFSRSKSLPFVGLFLILLTAFAGGRSFLAALVLAYVISAFVPVVGGHPKKPSRIKYFFFLGLMLLLMILYKVAYMHLLTGDLGAVLAALSSTETISFRLVEGSEPYLVMMNMQNALSPVLDAHDEYRQFFLLGWIPVLSNVFADAMGFSNMSFSDVLAQNFYTTVNYGMASTLVGELYYVGGYGLVLLFIIIFHVSLYFSNTYMYKYGSWATPALIWIFYYYHRLELKHLVYVLFVSALCFSLAYCLKVLLVSCKTINIPSGRIKNAH